MSKILIWETMYDIGGGQEMTLKVTDIIQQNNDLHFLIPAEGRLSAELKKRNIPYTLMGDQSMPKGTKGIKGLIKFVWLTFSAVKKGRKAVKKIQPDILYAPGPAALVWSAMCSKKARVVWHLHHMFQSGATLRLLNFFSAKKCVDTIISVSDCVAGQITNQKAQKKKKTIYNPIDMPTDCERKNLCGEYPKLDRQLKIGQVGFITPTKNQLLAIEVVKNLVDRGVDASLGIVGSVREGDDDYNKMLHDKITEYGIEDKVVFTGYRFDINEIIGTFDVVFVPSLGEGFSLVAVQAMMAGVPVLSIDNTGCTEVVTKSCCGMIFSKDSSVAVIADTLIKTAEFDLDKNKQKHSDFISECSYDKFCKRINAVLH